MSVVQITSPKAVLLTIGGGGTVKWTSSYDPYQTHYEIQYKLKSDSSWRTLGKLASNQKSADLQDIYNALSKDFTEFYYRVVIYYDKTESNGDRILGHETSEAYLLLFQHPKSGYMLDEDGGCYPLFDSVTNEEIQCIVMEVKNKEKKLPVVGVNHPMGDKNHGLVNIETKYYRTGEDGRGYSYGYKKRTKQYYGYYRYQLPTTYGYHGYTTYQYVLSSNAITAQYYVNGYMVSLQYYGVYVYLYGARYTIYVGSGQTLPGFGAFYTNNYFEAALVGLQGNYLYQYSQTYFSPTGTIRYCTFTTDTRAITHPSEMNNSAAYWCLTNNSKYGYRTSVPLSSYYYHYSIPGAYKYDRTYYRGYTDNSYNYNYSYA